MLKNKFAIKTFKLLHSFKSFIYKINAQVLYKTIVNIFTILPSSLCYSKNIKTALFAIHQILVYATCCKFEGIKLNYC